MLYIDLTIILTIMIIATVSKQSTEAREIVHKGPTTFSSHQPHYFGNNLQPSLRKNMKRHSRSWYLDPINIKLNITVGMYENRNTDIEELYSVVKECGLSRCGKFKGLIPENQLLIHLKCKRARLKKVASQFLSDFHKGVQKIEESFQAIIDFEREMKREKILEELKIEIKTLKIEIETVMTSKALTFPSRKVKLALQPPISSTDLILYEWRIIQQSRKYLQDWQKNFDRLFRCWKKRRQKNKRTAKDKIRPDQQT